MPAIRRAVRIRDDQWGSVAMGALSFGTITLVLGFVTAGGLSLVLIGIASALFGIWIFSRPVGIIIDSSSRAMLIRGFVSERRRLFDDVLEVVVPKSGRIVAGLPIAADPEDRYDICLLLRDGSEIMLRRDLGQDAAMSEAARVRTLIWPTNLPSDIAYG